MYKLKNIENVTILVIALCGIVISVFDIFGLLDISIIKEKTPQILLLLLSILLGYIIQFQRKKIEEKLKDVQERQIQNGVNHFTNYENQINPLFKKIFSDKISESFHFIRDLINSRVITINDLSRFRYYYKLIIEENPKKLFFVTSIPSPNYVWDSSSSLNPLEQAMKIHIENGGKFTRIIFVEENELDSEPVRKFIEKQLSMGVELFYVSINQVPKRLQKNFFYIENEELICEGFLNKSGELTEAKLEINKEKSRNFEMIFKQLMSNPSLRNVEINNK